MLIRLVRTMNKHVKFRINKFTFQSLLHIRDMVTILLLKKRRVGEKRERGEEKEKARERISDTQFNGYHSQLRYVKSLDVRAYTELDADGVR